MSKTAFLSSTAKDLAEHREAVHRGIQRMDGWKCIRMEDFGARDDSPDEFCRGQAASCHVFVGLVGHLYGSSPPGCDESFTIREYNAACEAGRPRLIFVAPDDFPLPASLRETDEKSRKQLAFRSRVGEERIRASFHSPDDLALAVVTALRNWERGNTVAQPETASVTPIEAPEKIIARLKTQSFFAMYGEPPAEYRAEDYIRLIAAPRCAKELRLDQAAQQHFEQLVESAFPEIRGFDQAIPRGEFYQIQSHARSRSSSHRVWCLWKSCAIFQPAPDAELSIHSIASGRSVFFAFSLPPRAFCPPRRTKYRLMSSNCNNSYTAYLESAIRTGSRQAVRPSNFPLTYQMRESRKTGSWKAALSLPERLFPRIDPREMSQ